jgi:hypothetical protein
MNVESKAPQQTRAVPSRSIFNPKFKYVNAARTDVRRTFRKFRLLQQLQAAQQGASNG